MADLSHVEEAYQRYVEARNALLDELQLRRRSNRDPQGCESIGSVGSDAVA